MNLINVLTMEIKINAIHFEPTEKLQDFVNKKVLKLEKSLEDIKKVEVKLTVVKPATALNKQASLAVNAAGTQIFVEKVCDTFEEAVTQTLLALENQVVRYKEKQRGK